MGGDSYENIGFYKKSLLSAFLLFLSDGQAKSIRGKKHGYCCYSFSGIAFFSYLGYELFYVEEHIGTIHACANKNGYWCLDHYYPFQLSSIFQQETIQANKGDVCERR
jgi:hypothetical protein